jgi:hypothetical protein
MKDGEQFPAACAPERGTSLSLAHLDKHFATNRFPPAAVAAVHPESGIEQGAVDAEISLAILHVDLRVRVLLRARFRDLWHVLRVKCSCHRSISDFVEALGRGRIVLEMFV